MGRELRATIAADLSRHRATGPAHALHQLDGRGGAYLEALGGLADGGARLNGAADAGTQVLRQGSRHDTPLMPCPQRHRIKTPDSVQFQNALASSKCCGPSVPATRC